MEQQPVRYGFERTRILEAVYHPMLKAQLRPDVIQPGADLADYKVLVSTGLMILDEAGLSVRLRRWIEAGGTWVAGPLTDIRDPHGSRFTHAPFGVLEDWAGVRCKFGMPAEPPAPGFKWKGGRAARGTVWQDGFELCGAEALATYTGAEMKGLAAVTRHKLGKGHIIVIGTLLAPNDFQRLILRITREAGIQPVARAGETLLVVPRSGSGGQGMVIVEQGNKASHITLSKPGINLLTGRKLTGRANVPPYGVIVLKHDGA